MYRMPVSRFLHAFPVTVADLFDSLRILMVRCRRYGQQPRGFKVWEMTSFLFVAVFFAPCIAHSQDRRYRPPRLENGQPDLQGVWDHSNATPLTRLDGFETLVISGEQAAAIDKIIRGVLVEHEGPNDPDIELANRRVEPIRGQWRSSIVVDPPDGKLPGVPTFNAWLAAVMENRFNTTDGPEQRDVAERCISDLAVQAPILYNPVANLHQIVQTKDVVVFHSEAMHDTRIIRLNARHAPAAVTSWLGDSIGWWEGDTLAVETRYFTPSDTGRAAPFAAYRVSPQATVTERFNRVSPTQLDYSFTVDDPVNYTRPWSGETQFKRSAERMFEYACHEGNRSLEYILKAARLKDGTLPP